MKDKLWFFGSARYFSVNNFIAGTFFDDGSQGIDDQFIKSALLRLTWQVTSKTKFSAYFDEIDKYRGHDMQSRYDPETAAVRVELAGLPHRRGEVDAHADEPAALRRRLVEQHSSTTRTATSRASSSRAARRPGSRTIAKVEQDISGSRARAPRSSQTTQSPKRHVDQRRRRRT